MKKILLTGATGYIGGRLLTLLQEKGYAIRCFSRRTEPLEYRRQENTELFKGDIFNLKDCLLAMQGMDTAIYLIHSMSSHGDFESHDRIAAENFSQAAKNSDVKRIIYVGGLGDSSEDLSAHLKSRQEVGHILKQSGVQVLEFRASIVIGSGSLSFELVRSLVDRLPVMLMPKWVRVLAQPIFIDDLLSYLEKSIELSIVGHQIFEIGGADVVSYKGLMKAYASQRKLKRWMIDVPVLTPYLSSLWLGLVTPVFARTGKKLIHSLKHKTTVTDNSAEEIFQVKPLDHTRAIEKAFLCEDLHIANTQWSDALSSSGLSSNTTHATFGRRLIDNRSLVFNCSPQQAFKAISGLGGKNGWLYGNLAWKLRGWVDLLLGGVGMKRGRPHPERLQAGDVIDWWRVEKVTHNKTLLLRAEMKLPGRAWLKYELTPNDETSPTQVTVTQTALFDPRGITAQLYWYLLYPAHILIFSGMLKALKEKSLKI